MKRTREDYERIIAELTAVIRDLQEVAANNKKAADRISAGADDNLDYAALGYTIHNLYGVMENYFLRIAKFFENGLDPVSWHSDLLKRMTIEIAGTRSALLSTDEMLAIDELRAFRHIFRHLYARPIDPEKLLLVQRRVAPAIKAFRDADGRYQEILSRIKDKL